jgi:hypothetical protein
MALEWIWVSNPLQSNPKRSLRDNINYGNLNLSGSMVPKGGQGKIGNHDTPLQESHRGGGHWRSYRLYNYHVQLVAVKRD